MKKIQLTSFINENSTIYRPLWPISVGASYLKCYFSGKCHRIPKSDMENLCERTWNKTGTSFNQPAQYWAMRLTSNA